MEALMFIGGIGLIFWALRRPSEGKGAMSTSAKVGWVVLGIALVLAALIPSGSDSGSQQEGETTPRAEAAWVATLAKLAQDPTVIKPDRVVTNAGGTLKGLSTYDYTLRLGDKDYYVTLFKSKSGAWSFVFQAGVPPKEDFAPEGGMKAIPNLETPVFEYYEITAGPLKNSILRYPKAGKSGTASVGSFTYFLERDNTVGGWLIEHGRIPGMKTIDRVEFYSACKQIIREHLLVPSSAKFQPIWDAKITVDRFGRRYWEGYVDSKNAFGVKIRNRFRCTYNPKDNVVRAEFVR